MRDIQIEVPSEIVALAAEQREAEDSVRALEGLTIISDEMYEAADAMLTATAQRLDAVVAMRKRATAPLGEAKREIEGWFRPLVRALEASIAELKRAIGGYRVMLAEEERKAREAAALAAATGDADALCNAMVAADASATPPAGRATCRFEWRIKRIAEDLLSREWLTPDVARIAAYAKDWSSGSEPPVIPGVVFERTAIVGARR